MAAKGEAGGGSGFRFLTTRAIVYLPPAAMITTGSFSLIPVSVFFPENRLNRPRRPVFIGSGLPRRSPRLPPRLGADFDPRLAAFQPRVLFVVVMILAFRHRSVPEARAFHRRRFARTPAHRRSSGLGRRGERADIPGLPAGPGERFSCVSAPARVLPDITAAEAVIRPFHLQPLAFLRNHFVNHAEAIAASAAAVRRGFGPALHAPGGSPSRYLRA